LDRRTATPTHYGMMRYHLGWADERLGPIEAPIGKRLRPLICLLTAQACAGGDSAAASVERAMPAAVALELLHNFTLIHDDVEDGDALRHHRPTVWKLWGEPQAINVGDGMHVLAHLALLELRERGVPAERVLGLAGRLAETSLIITEGQHLDMSFESRPEVTPHEYLDMIGRKSAALLGCAAFMGGAVSGADAQLLPALERFGFELGLGFQIRDDVLGIWGKSEVTGKPAGDLRRRKKTLPSMYALSRCAPDERAAFTQLFAGPEPDERAVQGALGVLERHGALEHCEAMVARHSESAREQLGAVPESEARDALDALVAQLETREF
jgi:geranylgeranyl diphosphate synthase type I